MKLRIRGNSVRIRVSQTEMAELGAVGLAQDSVEFGLGARLTYRVEVVPEGRVGASYEEHCISVTLPRAVVDRWQRPDEVSIEGQQPLERGKNLRILIEKDFACLEPREGEVDGDFFPNPGRAGS